MMGGAGRMQEERFPGLKVKEARKGGGGGQASHPLFRTN